MKAAGFNADNTCVFYDTFIPDGWAFEDCNEYEIYGAYRDDSVEFNKRKSSTHFSKAKVELIDDADQIEGTQYVSHFCFPFDLQFIAQE